MGHGSRNSPTCTDVVLDVDVDADASACVVLAPGVKGVKAGASDDGDIVGVADLDGVAAPPPPPLLALGANPDMGDESR